MLTPLGLGIAGLGLLFLLILLGVPIAFALAAIGVLGLFFMRGEGAALQAFYSDSIYTTGSYTFTVIPLFILMSNFALYSGISQQALNAMDKWFGRFRGGIAYSSVAACAVFAAASASSVACAVTIGKMTIPEMLGRGYSPRLATGVVAAAGTLGILIPPSIVMLIYAFIANVSIGKLFMAGFLPGGVSAAMYLLVIAVWIKVNPKIAPQGVSSSWKEKLVSLRGILGFIFLIICVMGSIYAGIATPNEAGAIGALGGFILLAIKARNFSKSGFFDPLKKSLLESANVSIRVIFIIVGAHVFSRFITLTGLPQMLSHAITGLELPTMGLVAVFILMYIILGTFLDAAGMFLITIPVILPTLDAAGVNGIWFGILAMKTAEIGCITPPLALNVFAIASVAPGVPMGEIYKGIMNFLWTDVLIIGVLMAFPQIVLLLPNMMK